MAPVPPEDLTHEVVRLRAEVSRLKARLAADEHEAPFRGTFELAAVGIAHIGPDGTLLRVNQRFCDILGHTHEELIGRPVVELTHPDDRVADGEMMGLLRSREISSYQIEKRCHHKHGHTVWVNLANSMQWGAGGEPAYVISIIEDISPRKQAEAAQRELNATLAARVETRTEELSLANEQLRETQRDLTWSHRHLRSIIDSTGDSICAVNTEYRLLVFNEAYARGFERRFGYRPEVGMHVLEVFHHDPSQRMQVRQWWERALAGEAYDLLREVPMPEGPKRYYDVRFTPLLDGAGRQFGAISVTREVTRLKHAEEELRHSNAALTEANRRLEHTNRVLEQRNRELQDFAYVASHDLQEPLRKVRAFADLLVEDCGERVDETGRYYLDRMQEAAARASQLISDLLSFSHVTTKAQPFETVDLEEEVHAVLSALAVPLQEAGGQVELEATMPLQADPRQVRQLLKHLLSNALKFRREGLPPRVQIGMRQEEGSPKVLLEVQDNGIGFDEKYLDRIFSPFQRLHGRGTYEGTGMGLAICRRIVERHGGTITARSTPGEGATFIVELPSQPPQPNASA